MNPRKKAVYGGVFDPKVVLQDIKIDKYYELPHLHPCFQPPQSHTTYDYESPNEDEEVAFNSIEKVIEDLFKMGTENLKGMEQEEAQVEDCNEEEYELDRLSMARKKIDDVDSVTLSRAGFDLCMMKQCPSKPIHMDKDVSIKELSDELFRFSLGNVVLSLI
ncbi:hypothetical protein Tco_0282850 [Tanacetum coccineum]